MAKDVTIHALVQSVQTNRKVNRDGVARKLTKIVLEADALPEELVAALAACNGDQEVQFMPVQASLKDVSKG